MKTLMSFLFSVVFCGSALGLAFVKNPTLTKDGNNRWWVEFELDAISDVAVSIVKVSDSSIVRHLAAGVLNATAPAPFAAGSLYQKIEWDGLDNAGLAAASPESLSVRVRAGMGVKLANLVGENYYLFNTSFGGIIPGPQGSLFILGSAGVGNSRSFFLRQYEASGAYMRTVYPPSPALPSDSVTAYGINVLPGGGWAPKTTGIPNPVITNSFIKDPTTQMLPIGAPGEIVLVNGTNLQVIKESGAFTSSASRKIITAPAAPAYSGPWGPKYFTASHNSDYLYLSGWYYGVVDMGTWLVSANDTGFWADGQVFRVNRSTGVVTPWLKIDSVPVTKAERVAKIGGGANATASIHGVAIDDSLRVYVCDRINRRIAVYDTNAVLLGSVPCLNPDFVAVSRRTGCIYVITRTESAMNLAKFASWRTPGAALFTTNLTTSINTHRGAPCMVLTETDDETIIWAGYERFGVRQYRDAGSAFELMRDFSVGGGNTVFDRLAVDPVTGVTYITNSYSSLWKIENWDNPVFTVCSTSAKKPLYAGDVCVAPSGLLYVRGANAFDGPIERYTQDHLHAPVNYANTGKHQATNPLYGRMGVGWGDKGFDISRQGQIGTIFMIDWNVYVYHTYPDTGYSDTAFRGVRLVNPVTSQNGGVKFDKSGNVYLGLRTFGTDRIVPPGFASDWGYGSMSGAVVRYAPGATGSASGSTVTGYDKIYPQAYGAFSADGGSACLCRSPRLDIDGYDRLFLPSGATGQVSVVDNAGNTILTFGQYGNTDARGGLTGPGATVAEPAIPFGWPIAAAATEDHIMVNDWVNARVARVQMLYELDNLPGLTIKPSKPETMTAGSGISLSASPNPFNPVSRIMVALNGSLKVRLDVYDGSGRLVRRLAEGVLPSGNHAFIWNATDNGGNAVAAGMYVYRLSAGNRVLITRTVLAR